MKETSEFVITEELEKVEIFFISMLFCDGKQIWNFNS